MVTRPAPATDAPSPMPTTAPVLRRWLLWRSSPSWSLDAVPLEPASLGGVVVSAIALGAATGPPVVGVVLLLLALLLTIDDAALTVELAEALRDETMGGGDVEGALESVVVEALVPVLDDEGEGGSGIGVGLGGTDSEDDEEVLASVDVVDEEVVEEAEDDVVVVVVGSSCPPCSRGAELVVLVDEDEVVSGSS